VADHPDPVEPSSEATRAREEAEAARDDADAKQEEAVEKTAEAAALVSKLVGHRRANQFVRLFREAFERHQ
jgi:hypothetical protein